MGQLSEPQEMFLGISSGKPRGRGVGRGQAAQIITAIRRSKAFKTGRLSDLSEMALYIEGINRDKISDLTTNIIRSKLVEYTANQCKLRGLPLKSYGSPPMWCSDRRTWISSEVELPYIRKKPVMLVPKAIVRKGLLLDPAQFYNKELTSFLQAEHLRAGSSLVSVVRGQRKVYKKDVKAKHPFSKGLIAELVAQHPELLELLKKHAAERPELVNTHPDDPSIGKVCVELASRLANIPSGAAHTDAYHEAAMGVITLLFYPSLILPQKEWEINEGRKRVDVVYTNDGKQNFFAQRRDDPRVNANLVIIECKNYSKDIANPELDQLYARFDGDRGRLGLLLCRSIDDRPGVLRRCRDFASRGLGYIIVCDDRDLLKWLDHKGKNEDKLILEDMHRKYRDLIS